MIVIILLELIMILIIYDINYQDFKIFDFFKVFSLNISIQYDYNHPIK